jgi:hypothetical protein
MATTGLVPNGTGLSGICFGELTFTKKASLEMV